MNDKMCYVITRVSPATDRSSDGFYEDSDGNVYRESQVVHGLPAAVQALIEVADGRLRIGAPKEGETAVTVNARTRKLLEILPSWGRGFVDSSANDLLLVIDPPKEEARAKVTDELDILLNRASAGFLTSEDPLLQVLQKMHERLKALEAKQTQTKQAETSQLWKIVNT